VSFLKADSNCVLYETVLFIDSHVSIFTSSQLVLHSSQPVRIF